MCVCALFFMLLGSPLSSFPCSWFSSYLGTLNSSSFIFHSNSANTPFNPSLTYFKAHQTYSLKATNVQSEWLSIWFVPLSWEGSCSHKKRENRWIWKISSIKTCITKNFNFLPGKIQTLWFILYELAYFIPKHSVFILILPRLLILQFLIFLQHSRHFEWIYLFFLGGPWYLSFLNGFLLVLQNPLR